MTGVETRRLLSEGEKTGGTCSPRRPVSMHALSWLVPLRPPSPLRLTSTSSSGSRPTNSCSAAHGESVACEEGDALVVLRAPLPCCRVNDGQHAVPPSNVLSQFAAPQNGLAPPPPRPFRRCWSYPAPPPAAAGPCGCRNGARGGAAAAAAARGAAGGARPSRPRRCTGRGLSGALNCCCCATPFCWPWLLLLCCCVCTGQGCNVLCDSVF